jgi:predicted nuclease with TOPRIM domain
LGRAQGGDEIKHNLTNWRQKRQLQISDSTMIQFAAPISNIASATMVVSTAEYEGLQVACSNFTHQNSALQMRQQQLQSEVDGLRSSCFEFLQEKSSWESESRGLRLFLASYEQKIKDLTEENQILNRDRASEAAKFQIEMTRMNGQLRFQTSRADRATADLTKELEISAKLRDENG